jgi:hypothetical protein
MSLQFRLLKQGLATTRTKPGAVAAFWSTPTTTTATTTDSPSVTPSSPAKRIIWKRNIVEEISETHELTMAKSERILNTVLDTIVEVRQK